MPRPRDQSARRESLRDAALRVLTERGVAATRLKDIAAEAGLNPATVLYYFPSITDLQLDVLRRAMDLFYERRREATSGIQDARERLLAIVKAGLPSDATDDVARLAWETIPFELRNPALADFDRLYVQRQIDLYVAALELGAAQHHFNLARDVRAIATNLLALEDYHGLRILLGWTSATEALDLVVDYASLATSCDLTAQLRAAADPQNVALADAADAPS
jgi:AcrR family transcriptional regulator